MNRLTEKRVQTFLKALVPLHSLHVAFVCLQWRLPFGRVVGLVLPGVSNFLPFVPLLDVIVRGVPVAVQRLRRVRRFQQLWVPVGHTEMTRTIKKKLSKVILNRVNFYSFSLFVYLIIFCQSIQLNL